MKIAVFCGSGLGNDQYYQEAAENLGQWIGSEKHTLVYGGGDTGLMGIVASNAKKMGSKVIGVIPGDVEFIRSRPQPFCDEVITVENMSHRKRTIMEIADAFIALPGGIGTIDEISEIITLTKIGVYNKKSVLFNAKGFYDFFKALLKKMEETDFLNENEMKHVLFSENIDEISIFLSK